MCGGGLGGNKILCLNKSTKVLLQVSATDNTTYNLLDTLDKYAFVHIQLRSKSSATDSSETVLAGIMVAVIGKGFSLFQTKVGSCNLYFPTNTTVHIQDCDTRNYVVITGITYTK